MQKQGSLLSEVLQNCLVFDHICQYLTIKEILLLSSVSKIFNQTIQLACKHLICENNMNIITNKSSIHQMQFYFNRCLRILKPNLQTQKNIQQLSYQTTLFTDPFKFQVITSFQVGPIYTAYLTTHSKAKLFRTKDLLQQFEYQQEKQIKIYQSYQNVKNIHCKAESALITRNSGQVSMLRTDKNVPAVVLQENILFWTNQIPIKRIECSYNYCIFIPQQRTSRFKYQKYVFGIEYDQNNSTNIEQESNMQYIVALNMLNEKYILISLECQQIIQCTVGHKFVYFISEKNEVFYTEFDPNNQSNYYQLHTKIYEPFIGKNIVKVANGFNFYIALQRQIDCLEDWDNQRVLRWLRQIGLKDFMKIAKVQNLTGKKLKNIERKYMYNVLGITKQNMQQKFLMSIEQYLKKKPRNDTLYGWGKNQFGQLGSSSANYINKPQRIRVNCLNSEQYIDSIFCGWFQTFIRTQKGRIYSTVRKIERKKKKQQKQQKQQKKYYGQISSDEDNFLKQKYRNKRHKSANKKKKKQPAQNLHNKDKNFKDRTHKKFQQQENWTEQAIGKSFYVQTYKNAIFYIQCPIQHKQQPQKAKKMRTAKAILDKILWSNLPKQDFKVGYMDKDMGLIEASAYQMEMFDVKQNRIKYFKRKDTIIWDRQQKIDLL